MQAQHPPKGGGFLRNPAVQQQDLVILFQALELSPDAVFVTDRSNRIVFWNAASSSLLGFAADDAVGRDCSELLRGCDLFGNRYCADNCPIMQIANRGEVVHKFSMKINTKNGAVLVDTTVLQLRSNRADEYWLAHIMQTSDESREEHEQAAPPKPLHLVAKESADARVRKLTTREVEVLGMLAAGRTTPEIAERLHISQLTARSHIQNILEKLEVHSKAEAVAFAFQKNLI
ncbi:MAG TPA: LuxR C-terminal-related transcriptional regulator [Thermoanaerobaculia bacterium]